MTITQAAWIIGIIVVTIGIPAVAACVRGSQLSRFQRRRGRENARLRAAISKSSIMGALRDE